MTPTLRLLVTLALGALLAPLAPADSARAQCTPAALALDAPTGGTLEGTDCTLDELGTDPGDFRSVDVYTVTLGASGPLIVEVSSGDFNTFLFLYDDGLTTLLDSNDDDFESTNSRMLLEPLAAGAYRVLVTSSGGGETGAYTVTATMPDCSATDVATFDATVEGLLEGDDCTLGNLGLGATSGPYRFVDVYRVTVASPGPFTATLESPDLSVVLGLLDETLTTTLAADGGPSARIELASLDAGVYILITTVLPGLDGQTGSYTLNTPPEPSSDCSVRAVSPSSTTDATLEEGDCALDDLLAMGVDPTVECCARWFDLYEFTQPASGPMTIDLESSDDFFDPYLLLYDDLLFFEIAVDDDGGEGLNSRIDLPSLTPGTYVVLASSLDELGDYTLTLAPEPPALLGGAGALLVLAGLAALRSRGRVGRWGGAR
jgi:hypothetical protein